MEKTFILASSSPRRIEMLRKNNIEPVIIPPVVDETLPGEIDADLAVMYLALKKGLAVEKNCSKGVIVAADTIVFKDRIIGKPVDDEDAFKILMALDGDVHDVITGVAILEAGTANRKVFYEKTKVFFKESGEQAIRDYVDSGEAADKAGGYAIQGEGRQFVNYIEGDFDNVVGFPWQRIREELKEFGIRV